MTRDEVESALREVIDPEVGVNVVDLGLIYAIDIEGDDLRVAMTMTTSACPLAGLLRDQAEAALRLRFPSLSRLEVEVTFSPPWDASRILPEGRRQLGWGA